MNPAIIVVMILCLAGCATTPKGYEVADYSRVSANADMVVIGGALADDMKVASAVYWSTDGDINQRILASVRELKHRGCIKRARAAGLSGSDADVLIGVALAGAAGGHPP